MLSTKTIGSRIAEARKAMRISQAQLAERLFISSQAVGKWERGESMPDITTFSRLAEILGVDLNYFSENHRTDVIEKAADEHLVGQSAEPQAGKQEKKLTWDMSRGNWVDADFSGLKNLHEKFSSSNMQRCKFIGSDMSGLLLKRNNVDSCDFSASEFRSSHVQNSNLSGNVFKDCSLKETEFSGSYVKSCDFTGADLTDVMIKSGGFEKNTVANALWNRTSFIATYIADVVFEGIMEGCSFENCAFKKTTFFQTTLINSFFKNSNLKRVQFVDCQADRITYEFLKNGKADLTGITLLTQQEGE